MLDKSTFEKSLSVVRSLIAECRYIPVTHECLIHGDLNHSNLLWKNEEPVFIDWEVSRYTIPEFEYGGICYCHGKSPQMLNDILDIFDQNPLVKTSLALKTADSVFGGSSGCLMLSWRMLR